MSDIQDSDSPANDWTVASLILGYISVHDIKTIGSLYMTNRLWHRVMYKKALLLRMGSYLQRITKHERAMAKIKHEMNWLERQAGGKQITTFQLFANHWRKNINTGLYSPKISGGGAQMSAIGQAWRTLPANQKHHWELQLDAIKQDNKARAAMSSKYQKYAKKYGQIQTIYQSLNNQLEASFQELTRPGF